MKMRDPKSTPKAFIISAFPGTGKTWYYEHYKDEYNEIYDSDSRGFSWLEPGVRNPDFPNNYIKHIQSIIDEADIIFVSSHKVVRDALNENDISFLIVYPSKEDKDIYMKRYRNRGNDESFINMMEENFEKFIDEIEAELSTNKNMIHVQLKGDMYVKDLFKKDDEIIEISGL